MWSLKKGLQQLPESMEAYLTSAENPIDIRLETTCTGLEFVENGAKVSGIAKYIFK